MKVSKVSDAASSLGSPTAAGWSSAAAETVKLGAIPVAAQPTAYIQEAWAKRPYASTSRAKVAAATDGERLYVRLEWADDAKANGEFPDGAAVVFPGAANSAVETLGSAAAPVGLWYWQNGRAEALAIESHGPGVFRKQASDGIKATAALESGRWSVVLSGPATAAKGGKVGVVVWNGSNEERAGLGAVSQGWLGLEQA
ncbi:MAG TPA: ethylbenzene dehydrogenase-related protein [Tepidiformaceae bacterium]